MNLPGVLTQALIWHPIYFFFSFEQDTRYHKGEKLIHREHPLTGPACLSLKTDIWRQRAPDEHCSHIPLDSPTPQQHFILPLFMTLL